MKIRIEINAPDAVTANLIINGIRMRILSYTQLAKATKESSTGFQYTHLKEDQNATVTITEI